MTTQNIIDCWETGVEPYTMKIESEMRALKELANHFDDNGSFHNPESVKLDAMRYNLQNKLLVKELQHLWIPA